MTTNPANMTRPWLRFGVGGVLAVTLVAIVAGFLWFRVCDQQVTSSGQTEIEEASATSRTSTGHR